MSVMPMLIFFSICAHKRVIIIIFMTTTENEISEIHVLGMVKNQYWYEMYNMKIPSLACQTFEGGSMKKYC